MLITFTSKVHPDVVMFGDVATVLLRAMGQSEQPPGILRGDEIRLAADKLRAYVDHAAPEKAGEEEDNSKSEEERRERRNRVGLRTRALPLLDLLDASYHREADVIWR
ncbi:MAG: DUF1840 family protein [Gammaproteobacteria bacterium]